MHINEIFIPFTSFYSNHEYEDTGLGISIVKKIIEKLKEIINVNLHWGRELNLQL